MMAREEEDDPEDYRLPPEAPMPVTPIRPFAAWVVGLDDEMVEARVIGIRPLAELPDEYEFIVITAEGGNLYCSARRGGVGLIVVDTTAAYFGGDDENSNTQIGRYARLLRDLALLPPRPTVLAASHPIKAATADTLLPRGGGAFLNELDGNLTLSKRGEASSMHWLGKHRGPDFAPLLFDMRQVTTPGLIDSRGREIPTVLAVPVGEAEVAERAAAGNRDDDEILLAIRADGNRSLADLAAALGWLLEDGKGDKQRAANATARLQRQDLIHYSARVWKLTRKGLDVAPPIAERVGMRKNGTQLAETIVANHRSRPWKGNRSGKGRGAE